MKLLYTRVDAGLGANFGGRSNGFGRIGLRLTTARHFPGPGIGPRSLRRVCRPSSNLCSHHARRPCLGKPSSRTRGARLFPQGRQPRCAVFSAHRTPFRRFPDIARNDEARQRQNFLRLRIAHRSNLMTKLGLRSHGELVTLARHLGLIAR